MASLKETDVMSKKARIAETAEIEGSAPADKPGLALLASADAAANEPDEAADKYQAPPFAGQPADDAPVRKRKGRCDGCSARVRDDELEVCPDCGYKACEDCTDHHSRGTCYCVGSNFGDKYCRGPPAWYHGAQGGAQYTGPFHPQPSDWDVKDSDLEKKPKRCSNCGEMHRMMKSRAIAAARRTMF